MDRRLLMVGAVVAVLVVLAASSGPVQIWSTPTPDIGQPTIDSAGPHVTVAPVDVPPADRSTWRFTGGAFLQVIGALLIAVAVAVALRSVGIWTRPGRHRVRMRRESEITPLPEVGEAELAVDLDAAWAALAHGGSPRNAIVACWMQLERDAAAAGMPRADAETSAEYVERVVARSSVDATPIGELAALYREARFSRHELRDDDRARAFAALSRVEIALHAGVGVTS